jgi:hypothetical protein
VPSRWWVWTGSGCWPRPRSTASCTKLGGIDGERRRLLRLRQSGPVQGPSPGTDAGSARGRAPGGGRVVQAHLALSRSRLRGGELDGHSSEIGPRAPMTRRAGPRPAARSGARRRVALPGRSESAPPPGSRKLREPAHTSTVSSGGWARRSQPVACKDRVSPRPVPSEPDGRGSGVAMSPLTSRWRDRPNTTSTRNGGRREATGT